MNAVAPISISPVHKPAYNNFALANFGNWYRDNEPFLSQYWSALGGEGPEARRDFFDFAASQYDLERTTHPIPVYARMDRCAAPARSLEEGMEHETGIPAFGPIG